jgi:hypothetical protein
MTLCAALVSQGQAWNAVPGGNVINGTEYLGARVGSTVPLRFTTIPNLRMEWRTNNVLRMLLTQTLTNQTVGIVYPDLLDLSGFLGLGAFQVGQRPYAMIHLKDEVNDPAGTYRPWYRTGLLINRDTDQFWIGLKPEGPDRADAVLNWSNNLGPDPAFDLRLCRVS